MRTLIIGIGNPLRGDDGLRWDVAGELSSELRRDDVQVLATHQLTPELSDLVSRADLVLFIDATRSEDPGTMRCQQVLPRRPRAILMLYPLRPCSVWRRDFLVAVLWLIF